VCSLVVLTVPSLYGPVNSLTVIGFVVAANQPCAVVDSWSLPKSQKGVNPSEGVRPPGKYGCIFDVWTDFGFCIRAQYLLTVALSLISDYGGEGGGRERETQ
jgi:hypothetical protein